MKYIAILNRRGQRVIRIFAGLETHADVAAESGRDVVSAGYVGVDVSGQPYAYGRSDSLNIDSDPGNDGALLRAMWRATRHHPPG